MIIEADHFREELDNRSNQVIRHYIAFDIQIEAFPTTTISSIRPSVPEETPIAAVPVRRRRIGLQCFIILTEEDQRSRMCLKKNPQANNSLHPQCIVGVSWKNYSAKPMLHTIPTWQHNDHQDDVTKAISAVLSSSV